MGDKKSLKSVLIKGEGDSKKLMDGFVEFILSKDIPEGPPRSSHQGVVYRVTRVLGDGPYKVLGEYRDNGDHYIRIQGNKEDSGIMDISSEYFSKS